MSTIKSVLDEHREFAPPEEFSKHAHIKNIADYQEIYDRALRDPEGFWSDIAGQLHWFREWETVLEWSPPFAKWFVGGKTNITYNCLDVHLSTWRKNKAAIIWEGEPGDSRILTYQELHREVCRFANVLLARGIEAGDRILIYMPMVPELAIAMLACARIGATHSIVFGGFSAEAIADRVNDCAAKMIITADGGHRKGAVTPLKKSVDEALEKCSTVRDVIVLKRCGNDVSMKEGRDHWWSDLVHDESFRCGAEPLDAEHPLFILYTSGTTGKPKGIVHTTGGYMVGTYITSKWVFDLRDEDTYWCTADIGWITGHSYIVYGPLANGATTVMYEGAPNYPENDRFWQIIDKYQVNVFYTAPTAIRTFMKWGDEWPDRHNLTSLRLLGTVGEPINPEAWMWYRGVIGKNRCPIVDTWWQTETGAIMITPLPGATPTMPGSATRPFPGIVPEVVTMDGVAVGPNEGGYLVIRKPWPSMLRTIFNDEERFKEQYWNQIPGSYFTGDGARQDEKGNFWLMGRVDDVINVSGHRLGTMEIESALVSHPNVAESAVVSRPDEIKGEAIVAFVTLEEGVLIRRDLGDELKAHVVKQIGALARPSEIRFTDALPKTRSGKIMRRLLKKIASGDESIGDITTLEDHSVLIRLREVDSE